MNAETRNSERKADRTAMMHSADWLRELERLQQQARDELHAMLAGSGRAADLQRVQELQVALWDIEECLLARGRGPRVPEPAPPARVAAR